MGLLFLHRCQNDGFSLSVFTPHQGQTFGQCSFQLYLLWLCIKSPWTHFFSPTARDFQALVCIYFPLSACYHAFLQGSGYIEKSCWPELLQFRLPAFPSSGSRRSHIYSASEPPGQLVKNMDSTISATGVLI